MQTPAFPVHYQERSDGAVIQDNHTGMNLLTYTTIEMAKALIGRKDSLIFSHDELALQASDLAEAILRRL